MIRRYKGRKVHFHAVYSIMSEPQTNIATMSPSESPPPQKERLPHSKWGIASFVLAILSPIVFFVVICRLTFYIDGMLPESHPLVNVFISYWYLGLCFFNFAALVFAIVGLCQPRTRKVFPICGIVFSTLPILFFATIIVFAIITGNL